MFSVAVCCASPFRHRSSSGLSIGPLEPVLVSQEEDLLLNIFARKQSVRISTHFGDVAGLNAALRSGCHVLHFASIFHDSRVLQGMPLCDTDGFTSFLSGKILRAPYRAAML